MFAAKNEVQCHFECEIAKYYTRVILRNIPLIYLNERLGDNFTITFFFQLHIMHLYLYLFIIICDCENKISDHDEI